MVSGIRSLPLKERALSFQQNDVRIHATASAHIFCNDLKKDFEYAETKDLGETLEDLMLLKDAAMFMFFGNILKLMHACLYEEKGDRCLLNIPLLLAIMVSDDWKDGICPTTDDVNDEMTKSPILECGFVSAIHFILQHSLCDMAIFVIKEKALLMEQHNKSQVNKGPKYSCHQCVSHAVTSSFPPTLLLL